MQVAKTAAPWFGGLDKLYIFITIFSIGNTALLNYLMGSRLLYGMSKQGLLPVFLGKVHAVRRTPHIAVGVLFLIVTALILVGGVKQLAEATALLLLTVFAVVNVSLVILKRRPGEPEGGFEVPIWVPIAGAVVCLILIGSRIHGAFQSDDTGSHIAPLVAGGIIGLSLLLYRILKPSTGVAAEDV
jgi:amino acid transporter